jgi:hypothetical protein
MAKNHERIHIDEKNLCHLCITELESLYEELALTEAELAILSMPRRIFTVPMMQGVLQKGVSDSTRT